MTSTLATASSETAIEAWLAALRSPNETSALLELGRAYATHRPGQAELIATSACAFACHHCIYPPTYERDNPVLDTDQWLDAVRRARAAMNIGTYIYSGRSVTAEGARFLAALREDVPTARMGLIDNGISVRPHLRTLAAARLDWIDISLDGMPRDHDVQRRRPGSFEAGREGLRELRGANIAPRISVLTCLTRINRGSVIEMISSLNAEGQMNFFITPVVVVPGGRPDPALALPPQELRDFVNELRDHLRHLESAYVEVGLFEPDWLEAISGPGGLQFHPAEDHLLWRSLADGNELCLRYFPGSLVGTRELIINSTGEVILPKSMAFGQIPRELVRTSALCGDLAEDYQQLASNLGITPFAQELSRERSVLGSLIGCSKESQEWDTSTLVPQAAGEPRCVAGGPERS